MNAQPSRSLDLLYQGAAADFVQALRGEALAHPATGHEYLRRFAAGEFPSMEWTVRDYALQYYVYSAGFTSYLQAVINGLPLQRHRDVLGENLREEQGEEDGEIPHAVMFDRFRRAAGVSQALELEFKPCTTVRVWRDLFLQKCQSSQPGVGIGAIGIATELLVSSIYEHLLAGIRDHSSVAPEHHRFFAMHIGCDDEHAEQLLNITQELCEDMSIREAVRFGVLSSLNLRAAFWDVMLARAQLGTASAHGH